MNRVRFTGNSPEASRPQAAAPAGSTVVFADVDGPLAPIRAYALGRRDSLPIFDPVAVAMVVGSVVEANAKIVVSSSWAVMGLERVRHHFEANGISWSLVHDDWMTPRDLPSRDRSEEIKAWLAKHPEVTRWAVLEDGHLNVSNLIRCCTFDGMRLEHWRLLRHLLGLETPEPVREGGCHHQWRGVGDGTYECVRCKTTAKPGDQHCPWTSGPPWKS